jgi:POT family proton-dependent oligopeptide transporter
MPIFEKYGVLMVIWLLVAVWVAIVILTNRKVHPAALFMLFLVELWERFSYYGMRALLVLYLSTQTLKLGMGYSKEAAVGIYAAYGALVYLTPLLGGFLADKFLGFRKAIIWGAVLMAVGQLGMTASSLIEQYQPTVVVATEAGEIVKPQPTTNMLRIVSLYLGLGLLVVGNGFFKPNISSLIGRFYTQGDPRRDGAFTIFYMGINIGAFLTPLTCGAIGENEGWHYGFLCAAIGMMLGLGMFLYTAKKGYLEQHAEPPAIPTTGFKLPSIAIYLGSFVLLPIVGALIYFNSVMDYLLLTIGVLAIGYLIYISTKEEKQVRERIWVIIVLLVFTAVFWTFFELAGSALSLFTESSVNKKVMSVFGFDWIMKTSEFQATNAFFIMLFAPVFTILWIFLAKRNIEPAAPIKFAFGLIMLGAGFFVLNLGKGFATEAIVPAIFLILLYLLHTLGELAISPVGLSLVTKLAPAKIVGFMMGFWFLSSAFAHQAGKWIATDTVAPADATPMQTLDLALGVFNRVGIYAVVAGVILLLLSPIIKKWMHGVK